MRFSRRRRGTGISEAAGIGTILEQRAGLVDLSWPPLVCLQRYSTRPETARPMKCAAMMTTMAIAKCSSTMTQGRGSVPLAI